MNVNELSTVLGAPGFREDSTYYLKKLDMWGLPGEGVLETGKVPDLENSVYSDGIVAFVDAEQYGYTYAIAIR